MYFISTIDTVDDDTRCVGYFSSFADAEKVVLNNICDIWETCYDLVVIEHIQEGLYQYDPHAKWYKWNTDKYERINGKPNKYKNQIGFAIG